MRITIRGMGQRAMHLLGLDEMGGQYRILVLNYVFHMLYFSMESIFVNTLLYTVGDSMLIVIRYRAMNYVFLGLMPHIAAYIGQRKTPVTTLRVGACLYFFGYILLFFGVEHMELLMYPIAATMGSGCAFYWTAHNQLVTHYTTQHNRDIGISILGVIQGIMTLCVPITTGFVIRMMKGITGYQVMFGVGMAAVVCEILVLRGLIPVPQKQHVSQIRLALQMYRKKLTYKLMFCFEFIRGFRDGTFAFLLNMLVFQIITDEALVGINSFLAGAASIVGSWVYGRLVREPKMRAVVHAAVALIMTSAGLLLFWQMNIVTVMLFSLLSSFLTIMIFNSVTNTSYDVLSQSEEGRRCIGESLAIREGALGIGRLLGLLLLMSLSGSQRGYATAIVCLTGSQLLASVMMRITYKRLQKDAAVAEEA